MTYNSKIEITGGDSEGIYRCFATECINKERSNFSVKKAKGRVIFEVKARDAVAFRATVNMITQLLAVYEKMKKIGK